MKNAYGSQLFLLTSISPLKDDIDVIHLLSYGIKFPQNNRQKANKPADPFKFPSQKT